MNQAASLSAPPSWPTTIDPVPDNRQWPPQRSSEGRATSVSPGYTVPAQADPHGVPVSAAYGQWARDQRPPGQGTIYSPPPTSEDQQTRMVARNPSVENSGSLTGHILAQGWSDSDRAGNNTTRVIVIMAIVLSSLVILGVLAALAAGDVVSGWIAK